MNSKKGRKKKLELSKKENFQKQQGEEEASLSSKTTEEKASKSCRFVETICWESFGGATAGPGGASRS